MTLGLVYPPGSFANVEGRLLHYVEAGVEHIDAGGPTYIIEAGCGWHSAMYSWLVAEIAKRAHVIAYDRAGLGWSDQNPADSPDGRGRAADLQRLIAALNLRNPLVLIGHSIGAIYLRMFLAATDRPVIAAVFLDPTHTLVRLLFKSRRSLADRGRRRLARLLAAVGIRRLPFPVLDTDRAPWCTLPDAARHQIAFLSADPRAVAVEHQERLCADDASEQARDAPALGAVPLLILTGGVRSAEEQADAVDPEHFMEKWMVLQRDQLNLSAHARQAIFPDAGHCSLVTDARTARNVAGEIVDFVASLSISPKSAE